MNMDGIKEYYESEYKSISRFVKHLPHWANKKEVINNALQRMLGVAQCAQHCGITYEEMDKLYSEYRVKIERLEIEENV